MVTLKLSGGTVYDPGNGIDGEVKDIWIRDARITTPPDRAEGFREIDLTGMVVMPGGVDMHCHVAGPKVNAARKMQPEQARRLARLGAAPGVSDIITTGFNYTALGYTTCFDAAVSPLASRYLHHEIADLPNLDAGFFVLVGNNHYVLEATSDGDSDQLDSFLGWLLNRTGAYAPKIVNPGGVELFKQRPTGNATDLDQNIDGFKTTPRKILEAITRSANRLALPHPVHIHANNLGIPGNWSTTLETMRAVEGSRAHLTHIQFHSYGGGAVEESAMTSQVAPLADFVNAHPDLSVDVGQVVFGPATSMTGDGPLGYFLQQISGNKWYCADTEDSFPYQDE